MSRRRICCRDQRVQRSSINVARRIFHHLIALDDVGVFQPHFAARFQPEIFRRRRFHEIVALDEQFAREWNLARAGVGSSGLFTASSSSTLSFGIIRDDNLDRPQHGQAAHRRAIELLAHGVLEHRHFRQARIFCDADVVGKRAQRARR